MKQRVLFFDIARALCVLWIVGVWHITNYMHSQNIIDTISQWALVTHIALAGFTFISGFFLGKKKLSALQFYKTRLKRFFIPLLATSLILSVFGWFDSPAQFILTITGFASFFGKMPATLWYFAMLIIFYLLTPLLLWKAEGKPVEIIARALVVYAIFYLLNIYGYCESRLLLYFPYYVAGMCLTMDNVVSLVTNKVYTVSSIVLLAVSVCLTGGYNVMGGGKILLGVYLLMVITYNMEKYLHPAVNHLFSRIAYASMFAYLFHREGYGVFQFYEVKTSTELPEILLPILTVIIFVVSYYMQMAYDHLIQKYDRK